jgi:phosphatidylserine decarboxylase
MGLMTQAETHPEPLPRPPVPITCDQPGGGVVIGWERTLARWRRAMIRRFFPGHVRRMNDLKIAVCPDCPHDVIDSRDLKYAKSVCRTRFDPARDPFAWRDRFYIARHGWTEIAVFGTPLALLVLLGLILTALGHFWGWALSVVAFPFLLFVPAFFRNPSRAIPGEPGIGVSPADGVITHVDRVKEPDFPGDEALRVSIFLSVFNVHVNRIALNGTIESVRYFPGEFLDARHSDCARRNEQLWVDLRDEEGKLWRIRQVSGAIARRIICQLYPGQKVTRGELFGLIKFGSRTELLWETESKWQAAVQVGQAVRGGETILVTRNA